MRNLSQTSGHKSCAIGTDSVVGWQNKVVSLPWEIKGECSVWLYSDPIVQVLLQKFCVKSSVSLVLWLWIDWIQSARKYHSLTSSVIQERGTSEYVM